MWFLGSRANKIIYHYRCSRYFIILKMLVFILNLHVSYKYLIGYLSTEMVHNFTPHKMIHEPNYCHLKIINEWTNKQTLPWLFTHTKSHNSKISIKLSYIFFENKHHKLLNIKLNTLLTIYIFTNNLIFVFWCIDEHCFLTCILLFAKRGIITKEHTLTFVSIIMNWFS